jgi:ABC-2 type transport system permease protein
VISNNKGVEQTLTQLLTWGGLRSIFKKEIIQLLRDPYLVAFIIALPIAQLLVTGLAIQRDLRHVPTLVYNYDNHNESIELIKAFETSEFFDIQPIATYQQSERDVLRAIRKGKYRVGIVIPQDYSRQLMSGEETANVQLIVDGTNANVSKSILDAANAVLANHANVYLTSRFLNQPLGASSGSLLSGSAAGHVSLPPARPISLRTKILNNPELSPSFFLIPGILAIIMHMMTVLFTSFSIVRERENGTLEQLMVSPLKVADLMVGKVLPYLMIGLLDMALTLSVMVWFFSIPISGSFWFLAFASAVFIVTSLGIGLVISTTCRSQVQAIQLTMGLLLPSLLLSGFVFPLEPMPWFIRLISYCLPLTYYLDIIRGVVIKGIGAPELWLPTLMLAIIAMVLVSASIIRFKKQVT